MNEPVSKDNRDWRNIPGTDGIYQIDRWGHVRSWRPVCGRKLKNPRLLTPYQRIKSGSGGSRKWWWVKLTIDGKGKEYAIHRLMEMAWMRPRKPDEVLWHKNGFAEDNSLANLEFINKHKLAKMIGGKGSRRTVCKIDESGETVDFYKSAREAAKKNYMSYQTVIDRCNGKVKSKYIGGYEYKWADDCDYGHAKKRGRPRKED